MREICTSSSMAGCGNGATAEPVRHRQTKGAATDMFDLQPPRHISTLRNLDAQEGPDEDPVSTPSGHSDNAAYFLNYAPCSRLGTGRVARNRNISIAKNA